jgi:protein MpaA
VFSPSLFSRSLSFAALALVLAPALAGCRSRTVAPVDEDPSTTQPDAAPARGRKITEVVGITPGQREILAHRYVGADPRYRALIFFSIHGDERPAEELATAFGEWLEAHPESWADREICFVPVMNPDGLASRTRVNGAGVDVNRNFPADNWQTQARGARYNPGPFAASEVETTALMRLIERLPPQWIVSIHAPLACVDWDGPGEALARAMSEANGLPARKVGYATPGSFGSWAGVDRGIPVVTLELDQRLEPEDRERQLLGLEVAVRWDPELGAVAPVPGRP